MSCNSNYFLNNATSSIDIQQYVTSEDPNGFLSSNWVTLFPNVRGAITPLNGGEVFQNGQLQSRASHKVLFRYKPELADTKVTSSYRLLLDGRVLSVLYINNLHLDLKREGKFYQEFTVQENGSEVQ